MIEKINSFLDFIAIGLIRDIELLANHFNCVLWIRDKETYSQLFLSSTYNILWGSSNLKLYEDPLSWQNTLNVSNKELFDEEIQLHRRILCPDYTAIYSINHAEGNEIWFQDRSIQLHTPSSNIIIVGCAIPIKNNEEAFNDQLSLADRLDIIIAKFCSLLSKGGGSEEQNIILNDPEYNVLSNRERQVLKLFLKGMTINQASDDLKLSPRTIETYLNNLKLKLNCDNKSELIMKAIEKGWLSLNMI